MSDIVASWRGKVTANEQNRMPSKRVNREKDAMNRLRSVFSPHGPGRMVLSYAESICVLDFKIQSNNLIPICRAKHENY